MTIEERLSLLERRLEDEDTEELTIDQALKLVSVGRSTLIKILAQNRREIEVVRNPATGWCIYPTSQGGRYRIFKRRFREWWANNPAKTLVQI